MMTVCLVSVLTQYAVMFGLGAFFFASLLLNWRRERQSERLSIVDYPRCGQCGYDLTGHTTVLESKDARCPECGQAFGNIPPVLAGLVHSRMLARRRTKEAMIAALLASGCFSYLVYTRLKTTRTLLWQDVLLLAFILAMLSSAFWKWLRARKRCQDGMA